MVPAGKGQQSGALGLQTHKLTMPWVLLPSASASISAHGLPRIDEWAAPSSPQ
ncbi:hypothetical protein FLM9_344 [Candidatus Synechococcus spongiarum]|uniref:Uncharacterized protein n=1 Tax=Candidatus Synechococcus spongiarum TaxID=431041 RepID=A0A164YVL3_9SYNE|nr:hypothetical protein FLM9_344 [Candidatus Synechococcus spongiarum]